MAEGCPFLCLEVLASDLDVLHNEVEKISALKKLLALAFAGQEPSLKYVISQIREQIIVLHDLLNKIESDCQENTEKATSLKELQDTVEKEQKEAQYFLKVLPCCFSAWESCDCEETQEPAEKQEGKETKPTKVSEKTFPRKALPQTAKDLEEVPDDCEETQEPAEKQEGKETKPTKVSEKPFPKKILPVTPKDLEEVPAYMKGRITCDQINAVVKNLNKAMVTKYKIRNQAPSSMNATNRSLHYRYITEETEDIEDVYFVVEEDIRLFTRMKLDRRFHQIIVILRHCQRVKEIRTSGIIRYAVC